MKFKYIPTAIINFGEKNIVFNPEGIYETDDKRVIEFLRQYKGVEEVVEPVEEKKQDEDVKEDFEPAEPKKKRGRPRKE